MPSGVGRPPSSLVKERVALAGSRGAGRPRRMLGCPGVEPSVIDHICVLLFPFPVVFYRALKWRLPSGRGPVGGFIDF